MSLAENQAAQKNIKNSFNSLETNKLDQEKELINTKKRTHSSD